MAEVEKFTDPKPKLALRTDVRFKKKIGIVSDFSTTMNEKLTEVQTTSYKSKVATPQQNEAMVKAAKNLSAFTSITKFLTGEHKIDIQYLGSSANFENVTASTYKTSAQLKALLPQNKVAGEYASATQIKRKTRILDKDGNSVEFTEDEDRVGFRSAVGETYLHNATLFPRLTTHNPIERDDTKNFEKFAKGSQYQAENAPLASTLKYLTQYQADMGQKMNTVLEGIIAKNSKYTTQIDDQFTINDFDKAEITIGFDDILRTPEIYKSLNPQDRFMVVLSAFDNVMRFQKAFSDIYGTGPQVSLNADPKATINSDEESKKSMAKAEKWLKEVQSNIDDPTMLLAVGLTDKLSGTISQQTNWGELPITKAEIAQHNDPRNLLVNGFFDYFNQEFMPDFKSQKKLTLDTIMSDNDILSNQIWSRLSSKGYIDEHGTISNQFNMVDPTFKLDLGLNPEAEDRVQQIMRKTVLGEFSFEGNDVSGTDKLPRQNLAVKNHATGKYEDLDTILSAIGKGDTWESKLESTLGSYDSLLEVYRNVVGATQNNTMTTQVKTTPTEGEKVKVTLSQDGKWSEKNTQDAISAGGKVWKSTEGQPLEIEFATSADAQRFADQLLHIIQLTSPVLGMFAPQKTPVLMEDPDNQNQLILIRRLDYDNKIYEKPQKLVSGVIESLLVKSGFEKILTNKDNLRKFKEKLNKWEENEEIHLDEEVDRVKTELQQEANARSETKRTEQRIQQMLQAQRAEQRKMEQTMEAQKRADQAAQRQKNNQNKS
jgi:hypothetical protein